MTSVQRYLSGRDNLVRDAAISASAVLPSTAIRRTAAVRQGGGRVRLAGEYTGQDDAVMEVEIVASGGIPRGSLPVFSGVGNGTLTVDAVTGAAPLQALTFRLVDLGVLTQAARLDVASVQIRARTPGAAGNAIRLIVEPNLTRVATDYSLLADWPAGQATQQGEQFNLGGLPMTASGELDPASPRLQLGEDAQVYRPYRVYKDGVWLHGLAPPPQMAVKAGTRAWAVTGDYAVTVTDGAASEIYAATTFYDLLAALAGSALVEAAGVVVADRSPGGQAASDVPLRTAAWLLAMSGKAGIESISVPAGAPTQTVSIKCVNADVVGKERWEVAGSVSGKAGFAESGTAFSSGFLNFMIKKNLPPANSGSWSFDTNLLTRGEGQGSPAICIRPFRFGASAKPKSVTFRYSVRPPADCDCRKMPTPVIDAACLGIPGEGADMEPAVKSRLLDLYAWQATVAENNTRIKDVDAETGYVNAETIDLDLLAGIVNAFAQGVRDVAAEPAALAALDGHIASVKSALLKYSTGQARLIEELESMIPGTPADDGMQLATVTGTVTGGRNGTKGYDVPGFSYYEKIYRGVASVADGPYKGYTESTQWTVYSTQASIDLAALVANMRNSYAWQARPATDGSPDEKVTVKFDAARFLDRVNAQCDHARVLAGIFPKSDASGGDAGSCWRDQKSTHWWVDESGYYLPAFTNSAYVSARRNTETGQPYSTQEFGFGLVVACPDRLQPGDKITINIEQPDGLKPYQVGDEMEIQTVAAGPAYLAGGIDGNDRLTWSVTGSVSGVLPDCQVPMVGGGAAWSGAGATVRIEPGGIAFSLGDQFSFAVEAGQFRWRLGEGAWSAAQDIPPAGATPLADGVAAIFEAGAAPSWVAGDRSTFFVEQPNSPGHLRDFRADVWRWAGDNAELMLDFATPAAVSAVAIARCRLPAPATVTWSVSADGSVWTPPAAFAVEQGVAVVLFPETLVRYLKIVVASEGGGEIGALWAGVPMATQYHATRSVRQRRWNVVRSPGASPSSLFAGQGDGWRLEWAGDLTDADACNLVSMADHAQRNDEPLIFVPHHHHAADAALVALASDALDISDEHEYQPDMAADRLLSASLQLDPVYF